MTAREGDQAHSRPQGQPYPQKCPGSQTACSGGCRLDVRVTWSCLDVDQDGVIVCEPCAETYGPPWSALHGSAAGAKPSHTPAPLRHADSLELTFADSEMPNWRRTVTTRVTPKALRRGREHHGQRGVGCLVHLLWLLWAQSQHDQSRDLHPCIDAGISAPDTAPSPTHQKSMM